MSSLRNRATAGLALIAVLAAFAQVATATSFGSERPRFVGGAPRLSSQERPRAALRRSFSYMTAAEMQATVASLTGYLHPAFTAFADVLGRYDPTSGTRTNDRPSLMSIYFMVRIAADVASCVVERELFLDDDERIVFAGEYLLESPTDASLSALIERLHTTWIGRPAGSASTSELTAGFRAAEAVGAPVAGYTWLVSMLLRQGSLYYY